MMQLHTQPAHAGVGCRRCSSRSCHTPLPIRRQPAVCRDLRAGVFASEAAASSTSQATSSTDTDGSVGSRQTYIQESISYTGAELAARLPSMQAAMRARAEATAAALQQSAAAPVAARPAASPSANDYAAASNAYAASPSYQQSPPAPPSSSNYSYSSSTASPSSSNSSSSTYSATPPSSPPAGNMSGLSASQKLEALQQAQAVSRQALAQASSPSSPYYVNAPKTIDVRMYDQLVVAHNKLSKKLGEANAHIDVLEAEVTRSNQDLMAAFELFKQIAMEFGTTSRLAQSTAAAVQFGVDPQDALDKVSKLQERLSTLEQAVMEQRSEYGQRVVRQVPVEWVGVASEVRVMGDFDGWTRGHELSAEDVTTDSVFSRFEGTLMLRPGAYRVKFLVDGEWRLADWPTEDDTEGNTVNVLTVA